MRTFTFFPSYRIFIYSHYTQLLEAEILVIKTAQPAVCMGCQVPICLGPGIKDGGGYFGLEYSLDVFLRGGHRQPPC